jgi:hypothetical protein
MLIINYLCEMNLDVALVSFSLRLIVVSDLSSLSSINYRTAEGRRRQLDMPSGKP